MVFRTIVIADQKEDRMLKYHHFMLKDKHFSHPFVSLEVVESLLRRQVMGICLKELALVVLKMPKYLCNRSITVCLPYGQFLSELIKAVYPPYKTLPNMRISQ